MARPCKFTFRSDNTGLGKFFGSLESAILELIWVEGESSARVIYEALRDQGKRISYGATKTVLDRLVRKRILQRVADGRRFLYTAKVDRSSLLHTLVAALLKSLRDDTDSDIVAALIGELSEWPDLGSAV